MKLHLLKFEKESMENYKDCFSDWNSVQKEYDMEESEPEEVLLAYYGYESYEGSSIVIYRKENKYYLNQGSHCSCYGLEGQWQPTEYDNKQEFLKCLIDMTFYSDIKQYINDVIKRLI